MSTPRRKGRVSAVYLVTNKVNGKIYVGSTKHLSARQASYRWSHSKAKKMPCVIVRAMRKYGLESFTFSVLQAVDNVDHLKDYEQFWIDKLNPFGAVGYNVAHKAHVASWEPKDPVAYSALRQQIALKHGEETRQRSSRAVHQIDKDTLRVVATFSSAIEADKALGFSVNSVNKVCRKGRGNRTAGGYFWTYVDDYEENGFQLIGRAHAYRRVIAARVRPVAQMSEAGETIRIWESGSAASKAFGVHPATVLKACKLSKRCGGFRWKLVEDASVVVAMRQRILEETHHA